MGTLYDDFKGRPEEAAAKIRARTEKGRKAQVKRLQKWAEGYFRRGDEKRGAFYTDVAVAIAEFWETP